MPSIISHESVKAREKTFKNKYDDTCTVQTRLLGRRGDPALPLAHINAYSPRRISPPHYHDVDQFQIMIAGKGKMGRRDIATNSVHYSNAYTAYGPFVADAETGLTCLIIRARPDTRAENSKDALAGLVHIKNRVPWQVTHQVVFPEEDGAGVSLASVPEITNEYGLATYSLRMKPGTRTVTPDPAAGNGLFVVLLKGSLINEGRESRAFSLVHVQSQEPKFEILAGDAGLEGLIVRFPKDRANLMGATR